MNCCCKFALAVGFLALPASLLAEEGGSRGGKGHLPPAGKPDHFLRQQRQQMEPKHKEPKQQRELTPQQQEKIKAAMLEREQKRKEHHREVKAKIESHQQEMRTRLANWKENHPNDMPPPQRPDDHGKRQFAGGPKEAGQRFPGDGHPGGNRK
ncbi:MAG: hypothetical protein ACKVP0_06955 [Pirellulaceae bacterium]